MPVPRTQLDTDRAPRRPPRCPRGPAPPGGQTPLRRPRQLPSVGREAPQEDPRWAPTLAPRIVRKVLSPRNRLPPRIPARLVLRSVTPRGRGVGSAQGRKICFFAVLFLGEMVLHFFLVPPGPPSHPKGGGYPRPPIGWVPAGSPPVLKRSLVVAGVCFIMITNYKAIIISLH